MVQTPGAQDHASEVDVGVSLLWDFDPHGDLGRFEVRGSHVPGQPFQHARNKPVVLLLHTSFYSNFPRVSSTPVLVVRWRRTGWPDVRITHLPVIARHLGRNLVQALLSEKLVDVTHRQPNRQIQERRWTVLLLIHGGESSALSLQMGVIRDDAIELVIVNY